MHRIAVIVCLLWITTLVCAQDPHPAFRQFSTDDGLPNSEVYFVMQDSKGYIWFSTTNGVSRYDGYSFTNFSMADGLPDNIVFETYEDPLGRIWFVSALCKLSYYYKGKIYPYRYNSALQKQLKNPIKTSFCVNATGTVFLGVFEQGIFEIASNGKITVHDQANPNTYDISISEPVQDKLMCTTGKWQVINDSIGINTRELKTVVPVTHRSSWATAGTRATRIHNKKILFAYFSDLYIVSPDGSYQIEHFRDRVHWIYEDSSQGLWIATYMDGLYYIENEDYKHKKRFLPNIGLNCLIEDREGGFWLASETNSVYYFASKRILIYDMDSGLKSDKVNALESDGKNMYIALQNGYIEKILPDGSIQHINCNRDSSQKTNLIHYLNYQPHSGQLFYYGKGLWGSGILVKDKLWTNLTYVANDMINVPGSNATWGCSSTGVFFRKNHKVGKLDPPEKVIYQNRGNVLIWNKNGIMIGTVEGLLGYDTLRDVLRDYAKEHPLLSHRIVDLSYTRDSNWLVIGTKAVGVLLFDGKHVIQIGTRDGLSNDNVRAVYTDSNYVWVGTGNGLNRIRIHQHWPLEYSIRRYTEADGLATKEINYLYEKNHYLWIATHKGISLLPLEEDENPSYHIPVYIQQVRINEKDTSYQSSYTLKYDQNNISIDFSGLSYRMPGQLRYRYKMEGLDTSWIYTKNHTIQFTTLPANTYTFHVSVQNRDGSWSSHSAQTIFIIKAPFWEWWWFRALIVAAVVYLIVILIRYRFRVTQRQKEKNEDLNRSLLQLKQKALRAQMNPHFTFNVMNSIQHFILHNKPESAHRYLSKFSKLVRIILNNSESNTIPISEEIKALELYLELEAMRFEQEFQYDIYIDPQIDTKEMQMPSMLIQPYVENSIKHGILPMNKPGTIRITLTLNERYIHCTIEDNGIGRAKASEEKNRHGFEHRSFGTYITQERLSALNELYNNRVSEKITDLYTPAGESCGTLVEIFIPHINNRL